jgi:2-polyprenyl-3-methyl-5-hydroxy-6-metoxy-1,4-benzoquinol methylase
MLYHRDFDAGVTGKYLLVANRLRPRSEVLEIGCHTGAFSRYLMAQGHSVVGLDYDESAVGVARDAGVDARCLDITEPRAMSALDGRFDAILLMDVLEHLPKPEGVLSRIRTLLKPQAQVLITGPNVAYWRMRLSLLMGRWRYEETGIMDRTHLRFYTAETWAGLVRQAGYEIVDLTPAESMIPLEGRMPRIWFVQRATAYLRKIATAIFPNAFTIVFLIQARPRPNDAAQS